jgi:hypothetical protein
MGGEIGHNEEGPPMGKGPMLLLVVVAFAALVTMMLSAFGVF